MMAVRVLTFDAPVLFGIPKDRHELVWREALQIRDREHLREAVTECLRLQSHTITISVSKTSRMNSSTLLEFTSKSRPPDCEREVISRRRRDKRAKTYPQLDVITRNGKIEGQILELRPVDSKRFDLEVLGFLRLRKSGVRGVTSYATS